MYKKTLSLLGVALALSAFASQAESERQASRERIVEQVLKPCEGKKAGDKVVITDRRGGEHIRGRATYLHVRKQLFT